MPDSRNRASTSLRHWLIRLALIIFLIILIIVFIVPLITIHLRLSRNEKIAHELSASLESRYPSVSFRGSASYETEYILITVLDGVSDEEQMDIVNRLRQLKIEQKIMPSLWLRFVTDDDERMIE